MKRVLRRWRSILNTEMHWIFVIRFFYFKNARCASQHFYINAMPHSWPNRWKMSRAVQCMCIKVFFQRRPEKIFLLTRMVNLLRKFHWFIGGQQKIHACRKPPFFAPNVNSYRRLNPWRLCSDQLPLGSGQSNGWIANTALRWCQPSG